LCAIAYMLATTEARNRCKLLRLDTDGLPENSPAQGRPPTEITPNVRWLFRDGRKMDLKKLPERPVLENLPR
jgi:hypothetical protein